MKSIIKYITIAGTIILLINACSEDFLNTTPTSAFTEANYVKNVEELETLLYASYSVITCYYPPPNAAFFNLPFNMWVIGNVGSDDAEKGGDTWNWPMQEVSLSMQTAGNDWTFFFWHINYYLIAKCNLVIDKSEEVEGNEEEIEIIVDQAKFLRALGYYNLVTIYGEVPMPTHWVNPDELNLERTSESEIWALIEQDLLDATDLPKRSQWNENGRITHGAVHALLGKVYMWQGNWDQAIQAYTAIIESGEYQLVDDYGKIHRHDGEHCDESILEFQQALDVEGGGHMVTWLGIMRLPRDPGWGGWGYDIPSQDLVDEFEPGDPRLLYTVNFAGDVFLNAFGEPDTLWNNNPTYTGYSTRKAWIPWDERPQAAPPEMNWRYCRYAEVLLFCAEALNENGQAGQARDYLNMVRKRARDTPIDDPQRESTVWDSSFPGEVRLPDVTTGDQAELRELIWKEQRVELAQEGHRRWILLRTGRFKEAMERAKGDIGCTVEDHEWLFPLPPDEVTNSFGRIKQNPGYN